jgi:hypothetical protein
VRSAILHRSFPGAALRFHSDAYSTVRSPKSEIAWPANKIVSFSSTRSRIVRTATPRCERRAYLRVVGYLLILILTGAFASYAERSILFSLSCFSLLSVSSSAWEKSINAAGGTTQRFIQFRGVNRPRQRPMRAEAR